MNIRLAILNQHMVFRLRADSDNPQKTDASNKFFDLGFHRSEPLFLLLFFIQAFAVFIVNPVFLL
jgi:hypothetical protein